MRNTDDSNMSTMCLTWINNELRKEVERREQAEVVPPSVMERAVGSVMKTTTFMFAIVTGVPTIVARVFGL